MSLKSNKDTVYVCVCVYMGGHGSEKSFKW